MLAQYMSCISNQPAALSGTGTVYNAPMLLIYCLHLLVARLGVPGPVHHQNICAVQQTLHVDSPMVSLHDVFSLLLACCVSLC